MANDYNKTQLKPVQMFSQNVAEQMKSLKDVNVRRELVRRTIIERKVTNPNHILDKWIAQVSGTQRYFSNLPKDKDIETMQDALSNLRAIEAISKTVTSYVFENANPNEVISPTKDMTVGDVPSLDKQKTEKAPFFLSAQKLKEITTDPIIPICKKDDLLVLLGKDTTTQEAVVFVMGLPQEGAQYSQYRNTEIPFVLCVGGTEPKFLGRVSYKPEHNPDEEPHQQMHIENNKLCFNKEGALIKDDFDSKVVHYHSYMPDAEGNIPTLLINPLHYSGMIKQKDNDYLPPESATCQNAIVDMLNRFNVLTPNFEKTSDLDALPDDLTQGAIESLGVVSPEKDYSQIQLTAEVYDLILPYYLQYIQTGKQDYPEKLLFKTDPDFIGQEEFILDNTNNQNANSDPTMQMPKLPTEEQPLEQ